MTPHLHPRSRLTTSLFGTTLMVSFLVVAMPHIVPCPVPRLKLADEDFDILEDGRRRRRRRNHAPEKTEEPDADSRNDQLPSLEQQRDAIRRKAHECPVPKPRGRFWEFFGVTPGSDAVQRPDMAIGSRTQPRERNGK